MHIEIFTGPGCGYCAKAKELLQARRLAFTERDLSEADVRAEFARRLPREKAIPQIFIDDVHVGGYEDLAERLG